MSVETVRIAPEDDARAALEAREACPSCAALDREPVWCGRFDEDPVRAWIARHGYGGDPAAELAGESFELARCRACSLLFHARVLDSRGLTRLYETWIDGAQIERFEVLASPRPREAMLFEVGRQQVKHLLRLHRLAGGSGPFRLLDFGCGDGRLLRIAQAFGFDAHGIDPSSRRDERAARAGLRVHRSLDALRAAEPTPFDAVTLIEVLEHLTAPREALEALARVMRPGAVLLVEVPDARGIAGPPRTFSEFRVVHPLEHVNPFTPDTLDAICARAGFRPVPRVPAHVTARLRDVIATELSRFVRRRGTSRYYVRP